MTNILKIRNNLSNNQKVTNTSLSKQKNYFSVINMVKVLITINSTTMYIPQ